MSDWVDDENLSPEETWERFKALSPQRAKDARRRCPECHMVSAHKMGCSKQGKEEE